MSVQELIYQFREQLLLTGITEWVAVLFGVASVILASRNNVLLYPTGIVSTSIFIFIFIQAGLYAEALLNVYYFIMSIYGWARWNTNKENLNAAAVSHNNAKDWGITILIVVLGWILLYTVLDKFTDSTVPVWDAVVSATAWAGMWLLAKHKVENWVLLNISNAIAIPLLIYKQLPLTAILTLILFIVAVIGYFKWRRMYREQH